MLGKVKVGEIIALLQSRFKKKDSLPGTLEVCCTSLFVSLYFDSIPLLTSMVTGEQSDRSPTLSAF